MLALHRLLRESWPFLVNDVERGGFFQEAALSPEVRAAVASRLDACPERARELRRIVPDSSNRWIDTLWPALRLVVTWTRAGAGVATEALRRELPPTVHLMELGYIASELRGTVTLGRHAGTGLPTLDTHFFEFVERRCWDEGRREFTFNLECWVRREA